MVVATNMFNVYMSSSVLTKLLFIVVALEV